MKLYGSLLLLLFFKWELRHEFTKYFYLCFYLGHRRTKNRHAESTGPSGGPASGHIGITVHISVEFSYEELATATNDFSMASKIGEGGFGAVYYAELRGKVCIHKHFFSL